MKPITPATTERPTINSHPTKHNIAMPKIKHAIIPHTLSGASIFSIVEQDVKNSNSINPTTLYIFISKRLHSIVPTSSIILLYHSFFSTWKKFRLQPLK